MSWTEDLFHLFSSGRNPEGERSPLFLSEVTKPSSEKAICWSSSFPSLRYEKCSSALSFSLITRFLLSPLKLVIDDSVAMTPFYLLLGKHRQQQQEHQDSDSSLWAERTALPQTSASMKEVGWLSLQGSRPFCAVHNHRWWRFKTSLLLLFFPFFSQLLQTPAHVLPSTSYLCSMFVQSLLISVSDARSVIQLLLNNCWSRCSCLFPTERIHKMWSDLKKSESITGLNLSDFRSRSSSQVSADSFWRGCYL